MSIPLDFETLRILWWLLLGVLLMSSLVVSVANMLVDLLHALLDPRIQVR